MTTEVSTKRTKPTRDVQIVHALSIDGRLIDIFAEYETANRAAEKLRRMLPDHMVVFIDERPVIGRVE